MAEKSFVIDEKDRGARLDKVVASTLGLGRAAVRRLFDDGKVRVDRRRAQKGDVVEPGHTVSVQLPDVSDDAPAVAHEDPAHPLVVILETPSVVVVDKPAGQPTAPLRGGETGTLANALVARFPEMAGVGFHAREPGLVHRLDNDTSGVVVAARSRAAWDALVEGTRSGALDKLYLAVCEDREMPDSGTIEIPLAPHPKDRRRVLACLHPRDVERLSPRPASTTFRVVSRAAGACLVEVRAPRALRHQIRAHLAAIDCPIVGDTLYGAKEVAGLGRHALHAASVTWKGAAGVPAFTATSELPPELAALVGQLPIAPHAPSVTGKDSACSGARLGAGTAAGCVADGAFALRLPGSASSVASSCASDATSARDGKRGSTVSTSSPARRPRTHLPNGAALRARCSAVLSSATRTRICGHAIGPPAPPA